ncbi:MAG: rRNA maturation RNase YbeY [Firmicutes bacterium]|nr:rRNA maturation RNase YbeY [Bacillota bacterium]
MELIFGGEEGRAENLSDLMEKAAAATLGREGVPTEDVEISITFVDDEEIRELNAQYRDVDKVTDVLSFPQFESPEELPEEGEIILGDVVLNVEQAKRQAEEYGHSEEREIIYLFVHSLLHLLGYDHMEEDEKAEMRGAEEEIMNKLGLPR